MTEPAEHAAQLSALLMQAQEMITPIIEFAEGQRQMLETRGWSPTAAEQYALTILLNLTARAWGPSEH